MIFFVSDLKQNSYHIFLANVHEPRPATWVEVLADKMPSARMDSRQIMKIPVSVQWLRSAVGWSILAVPLAYLAKALMKPLCSISRIRSVRMKLS